jgi:hypothetical protein
MRTGSIKSIFLLSTLLTAFCTQDIKQTQPPAYVLEKHRQFSQYTDPGKFSYLYYELPESMEKLSELIKKQLIHPFDADKFAYKISEDRMYEGREFYTVSLMLEELLNRDENGLSLSRKPENRLIAACVHHCMLYTSILRHRGIPVRIRNGHAKYIGGRKDVRVTHAICEVWDKDSNNWILVDPDRQKFDFSRHEFEFTHETWNRIRNNNLGNERYVSRYGNVVATTVHLLCHDVSYILGQEISYWLDPPIVSKIKAGISDLSEDELQLLDKISEYLKDPDNHLDELASIQAGTPFLCFEEP